MKLFIEKSYEINIYGDIDINIKDYVDWLGKKIPTRENLKEIPTRENLQEYIEEKLEFDRNLIIGISDVNLDSSIDYMSSISFPGARQYKKILYEAEKLQNELKAENQTLE